MQTDDLKNFINNLNAKERMEYQLDIVELKKQIWQRVASEQKASLRKYTLNNN